MQTLTEWRSGVTDSGEVLTAWQGDTPRFHTTAAVASHTVIEHRHLHRGSHASGEPNRKNL